MKKGETGVVSFARSHTNFPPHPPVRGTVFRFTSLNYSRPANTVTVNVVETEAAIMREVIAIPVEVFPTIANKGPCACQYEMDFL